MIILVCAPASITTLFLLTAAGVILFVDDGRATLWKLGLGAVMVMGRGKYSVFPKLDFKHHICIGHFH